MTLTKNTKVTYILLALLSIGVFLNSLSNGFVYDDIATIEDNYFIRSLLNLPKILSKDYFQLTNELSYRPVVTLSYFFDYAIWKHNPFGYHLFNVILHSLNCVLLYTVIVRLFKSYSLALISAVIFSVHPCVTEAVNAISFREDLFVVLFSFLSFLCLIIATQPSTKQKWLYYTFALISYLFGLFSKETAIVIPIFIFLYWLFFLRHNQSGQKTHEWAKYFKKNYLGYLLISLFYVFVRFVILKNPQEPDIGYIKESITINFLTMTKVLASYTKLMFLPIHLSADYQVPSVVTFFDASFIISILLLAAITVIIFRGRRKTRLYVFFSLCFFISLLPVLNIVPIGNIMAERYLYFPVAGFSMIIGTLFSHILDTKSLIRRNIKFPVLVFSFGKPAISLSILALVCLLFAIKTMTRNHDWRDEYTFWEKILEEQPQNFDAHNNIGNYYFKRGHLDKAIQELEEAVRLKQDYAAGHNSLGTLYIEKGFVDKAIIEYTRAIKLKPIFPEAYYNLGNAYLKKGLLDDSIRCFKKAIHSGMYNPSVFNNLGSAYLKKGMMDQARIHYQKALSVYGNYVEAHSNLGYLYTEKGQFAQAESELKVALKIQPKHANTHNNLGAVYGRMKKWGKAKDEFLMAVKYDPENAGAYKNLGILYFNEGKHQLAKKHFIQMLKIKPDYLNDPGIYGLLLQLGIIKE